MKSHTGISDEAAIELVYGLVHIPSVSQQERDATAWLVAQMADLGFGRAWIDEAGNAVGEIGVADAPRTIVLLGHIDTVPGAIPVRIEEGPEGPLLYGRGSVDAKGPLATFVAATPRLGEEWARAAGVRIVVVGAVEEETAGSRGARFIRDRFDGVREPLPIACIIGEPSGWSRVTLGYKGRQLVEIDAAQPMAHTAGPDAGVAVAAVELWNRVSAYAARFNEGRKRAFDQLQPSLRRLATSTDAALHDHVELQIGVRLPPGYDVGGLAHEIVTWAAEWTGSGATPELALTAEQQRTCMLKGAERSVAVTFHGYESAWRSDRSTPVGRSFLTAIRTISPESAPTFVVKTGTSDMNVVGPAWRCPIVAYGPGNSALDHTPHEHLALREYLRAIQILEFSLRDFASISS